MRRGRAVVAWWRGTGTSQSPARAATGEVALGHSSGAEQRPAGDECWCSAVTR